MAIWVVVGSVFFLLAGCGEIPYHPTAEDPEVPDDEIPEACSHCDIALGPVLRATDPPVPTPGATLTVSVWPEALMFYHDASAADLKPRAATVTNDTADLLYIEDAYAADYVTVPYGEEGDASYFQVEETDPSEPLEPGDSRKVLVTFKGSSAQRAALLVIETSHPSFPALGVDLSGKSFW